MKLSIFTTVTDPITRQDPFIEACNCYLDLADELVIVDGGRTKDWHKGRSAYVNQLFNTLTAERARKIKIVNAPWPQEFLWMFIGRQFQRGYEACTGDWVIHADLDYFFHQDDHEKIRQKLTAAWDVPAMSFWKYQFLLADRYRLKSRLVIAVNRKLLGDRIRFDGGGDLCQPTLDRVHIKPEDVPEAQIPFYNYDFLLKSKETVKKDFARFARAWQNFKGYYELGGPDDESAFEYFCKMQLGRFEGGGYKKIAIEDHPKYIRERIKLLNKDNFGHNMWGMTKEVAYG